MPVDQIYKQTHGTLFTGLYLNNVHCCDLITHLPFLITTLHLIHGRTQWSSAWRCQYFGIYPSAEWLNWADHMASSERCETLCSLRPCASMSIHRHILLAHPDGIMKQKPECSTERKEHISDWPSWMKWTALSLLVSMWLYMLIGFIHLKRGWGVCR